MSAPQQHDAVGLVIAGNGVWLGCLAVNNVVIHFGGEICLHFNASGCEFLFGAFELGRILLGSKRCFRFLVIQKNFFPLVMHFSLIENKLALLVVVFLF